MDFHLDVVSAEGELYSDDAHMVFVAAQMGEMGIAARHAPLLTRIKPGPLRIQHNGNRNEESFFVSGGILEVQPQLVTVLADTAERAEELDRAAAEEAKKRAEKAIGKAKEDVDHARAQAALAEAEARLEMIQHLHTQQGHSLGD